MQKGVVASLFDVSFESSVATRVIRALYALVLVALSVAAVVVLIAVLARGGSPAVKLAAVVGVPLGWVLYVVWSRVVAEVVIAVFKLLELTREIAESARAGTTPVPTAGDPAGGLL